eukprot:TCONS_00010704-protein
MQKVEIIKIENAGKFQCRSDLDCEAYADNMADMYTYFMGNPTNEKLFVPKLGEVYACYTSLGEGDKMWYRCLVTKLYNSKSGLIMGVFLVDEGEQVCVTKARMRDIPDRFKSLPHRVMKCTLDDLVPVTLNSYNADLEMSLQKAKHWDPSATTFLENLLEDSHPAITIHSQDEEGTMNVTLYTVKGNATLNVNELLEEKKFAVKSKANLKPSISKLMPDIPDSVNKDLKSPTPLPSTPLGYQTPSKETTKSSVSVSTADQFTPDVLMKRNKERQRQMELKKQETNQFINKECQDLLDLLHGDTYSSRPAVQNPTKSKHSDHNTSETSDFSDIESTPLPKDASYKQAQRYSSIAKEQVGENVLAKLLGIKPVAEKPKMNKIEEFLNTETQQSQPFDIITDDLKLKTSTGPSHLTVPSQLIRAIGSSSKRKSKDATQLDVLVYGKEKREPIMSLEALNLPDPIVSYLRTLSFDRPSQFQMHMWPAILASKNVVGIADTYSSGISRILSYLLPLIRNLIMDNITYPELGRGNGPYVIICVNEWQEAQLVYDLCEKLLVYYKKRLRVDVRYGGMDNRGQRNIRMLNGCEILVTTIISLNEAIEAGYTNLNRLCHIVFDNAHKLFENFTEDVQKLMLSYETVMQNNSNLTVNQIIVIGMKWSFGIDSFMRQCINPSPLVVISNKIEAALFAKVPITVEVCKANDRLEYLTGFLETDVREESSIIFTNSARTADELQQSLRSYSIAATVITEFMQPTEIKDARSAWNSAIKSKGMNVLVLSDQASGAVRIRNASVVVHYDFPNKKDFGNRLLCLLNNIQENENNPDPKKLLSHLFVTEQNNGMKYSTGLVKLLKRSGQHIPEHLKSMAASARELKEEQKQYQELCPRLKLFGECSYIDDCSERHSVFPDKDFLGLCPNTGFVKVKILDVVSASCFFCRIIEHRLPFEGQPYDTSVYLSLNMDMNLHYSAEENRKQCSKVEKYDICVAKCGDFNYERVRIEKVVEKDLERPKILEVFSIDNGLTKVVKLSDLLICDDKFKSVPHQAIEVIACCVKPVERGTSWTHESSATVEKKIKGKVLEGRVKLSLQNTMWVDPLAEKELLEGMHTMTYTLDIGRELINLNFAEKNTTHLENLRKLLYDVQGHTLETKSSNSGLPLFMLKSEEEFLSEDTYEEVYVSSVTNPALFFVQRAEHIEMLDKLDAKIDATMTVTKPNPEFLTTNFPIGYICVAKFSVDDKWYRGKILGLNELVGEYDVFFVDHGDREWIGKSKVVPAWPDIMTLPFQAIQCSFKDVTPKEGNEWTLEDGDVLWDKACEKLLQCQALSVGPSDYIPNRIAYVVSIFDTTGNINVNISHELVYAGIASGSLECLQTIFPKADTTKDRKEKVYKNGSDEIPDLCVDIYLAQHGDLKISLSKEITHILAKVQNDFEYLTDNDSIQSLCKLLALNHHEPSNEELLAALEIPLRKDDRCAECMYHNNGIQVVLNLLKDCETVALKKASIRLLKVLARDEWYQGTMLDYEAMKQLVEMMKTSQDSQMTCLLIDLIGLLCRENSTGCAQFRQQDGLELLCKLVTTENTDFNVLDSCGKTFLEVLDDHRNCERIRNCGGLQDIVFVIGRRLTDAVLLTYLEILHLVTQGLDNVPNREHLYHIQAHKELRRISQMPVRYSPKVKELFQYLIEYIEPEPLVSMEQLKRDAQEIDPRFYSKKEQSAPKTENYQRGAPMTFWSQVATTITLSINLRGVEAEETVVQPFHIVFKTFMNSVEYILDLKLYAEVDDKNYNVDVKGGEVLIKLQKVRPDFWPRLVESKQKLPYLRYDFDRWQEGMGGNTNSNVNDLDDDDNSDDSPVSFSTFLPGLPPPPKSKPDPTGRPAPIFDVTSSDSSGDESNDDDFDDGFHRDGVGNDFFKL